MNKELAELVATKQAAIILNAFGYFNADPNNVKLLDSSSTLGVYDFILVKLQDKKFQLTYENDGETKSWNLLDVTE